MLGFETERNVAYSVFRAHLVKTFGTTLGIMYFYRAFSFTKQDLPLLDLSLDAKYLDTKVEDLRSWLQTFVLDRLPELPWYPSVILRGSIAISTDSGVYVIPYPALIFIAAAILLALFLRRRRYR